MLRRYADVPDACTAFRSAASSPVWTVDRSEVISLRWLGRFEEAREALERWKASEQEPMKAANAEIDLLRDEGRVPDALALNRKSAKEFPEHPKVWEENNVFLLRELGQMQQARAAAAKILSAPAGRHPISLVRALVTVGRLDAARQLIEANDWSSLSPDFLASAWSLVEDADKAVGYLRKMADAGWTWSPHVAPDPDKAFVWDDPRFVELREKHAVVSTTEGAEPEDH